jgi:hypothetical protein
MRVATPHVLAAADSSEEHERFDTRAVQDDVLNVGY